VSTPVSMPQEPAVIPALSLPGEVEGATAEIEAPAKRRVLACPEALKPLDNNAEDRWNQISRTVRQDFLDEFAADELTFQLQCQAEREKKNNLPYDEEARLKIWDSVCTKLGVKGRFTQPVPAPVPCLKPLPDDDDSANAMARVWKPKTWAEAIEIALPFLGRSIRNYPLDGIPKTEAEHKAVGEYQVLLQKKEIKLRAMVQAGHRPDHQGSDTPEVDFIVSMAELTPAEAKMTPAELQISLQEYVNAQCERRGFVTAKAAGKPGRPKGAKDGKTVRRKNKKHENATARVRAYRQRKASCSM
jgi:hypothetical protein